jgi:HEAT repeat protein
MAASAPPPRKPSRNSRTTGPSKPAVEALITAVYDSIAEVSQAAIRALGLIGDERAIDCLVSVVRNTDNYYLAFVRQAAVEALGQLAAPSARESLQNIATDSGLDPSVRQAAGTVLSTANGAN